MFIMPMALVGLGTGSLSSGMKTLGLSNRDDSASPQAVIPKLASSQEEWIAHYYPSPYVKGGDDATEGVALDKYEEEGEDELEED